MNRMTVKRDDGRWAIANNDGSTVARQFEKLPVAIDRLAAYEDTGLEPEEVEKLVSPPNAPLTLEELREMVGEPVWIEFIHTPAKSEYRIIRTMSDTAIRFQEYDKEFGPYASLFLGHYGKTWLAYRNKPENT